MVSALRCDITQQTLLDFECSLALDPLLVIAPTLFQFFLKLLNSILLDMYSFFQLLDFNSIQLTLIAR